MNYFEHHIRDYDTATQHLSWDQDLAYTRLIRWYYRKEKPVPADVKEACRQVRAVSKAQRDAVAAVLAEFFELRDDGWHNDTCDQAIRRFKEGEPEREVKKANEENRVKRHRDERARLFKVITDAGQHAPWNIGMTELRDLADRVSATNPVTPDPETVTPPVTAPVTPATATQSPITNHQSPELTSKAEDSSISTVHDYDPPRAAPLPMRETPPMSDDPALQMSTFLRRLGVDVFFTNPHIQEWVAKDVTFDMLTQAVDRARESKGPTAKIHPNYLATIVPDLLNPPAAAQGAPPRRTSPYQAKQANQQKLLDRINRKSSHEPDDRIIDINDRPA